MNTSLGYAKKTLTNSNVLLSGGGDKALSEFIGSLNWDSTNNKLQYKSASSTDFTDLITFGSNAFTNYSGYDIVFLNNEGTTVDTFKALTSPSKTLKAGTNVQMTADSNVITITATDTWNANAVGVAGYVAAPTKADNANMTWLTDSDGNPAWRTSNNHSHNYLPLSGGTIESSAFAPFNIQRNHTTNTAAIGFKHYSSGTNVEMMGYVGMNTKNGPLLRLNAAHDTAYTVLDTENSSVSLNDSTLTVKINGTSQSLTNTWRGILNNLTSDSTTDSLSAAQGKALNDNFANYLPLSGGTLSNNSYGGQLTINRSNGNGNAVIVYNNSTDGLLGRIGITGSGDTLGKGHPIFHDGTNNYELYHTGNLPAYPTKASWNYDDVYVSSLAINGNLLRWVKNGSNNDITIPYATSAGSTPYSRSFSFSAGSPNVDWVSIAKLDLSASNNYDRHSFILSITRNYNSPSSESYLCSVVVGWKKALIRLIGKSIGAQIITQVRLALNSTDHYLALQVYVKTSAGHSNGCTATFCGTFNNNWTVVNAVDSTPSAVATCDLTSGTYSDTAGKATEDGDGNTISSTYLPLSGGTMTGTLTVKTDGTNNYNQGIRINRTATNKWALLLIGKSGDDTLGTGTSTAGDGAWLIGTPASSNSLIFNLNSADESKGLCLKGHGTDDMKWNNNTVYHAGNLPAYPTKSSWNYDDMYVSSITTNGDYLRWVKNGTDNDITIPYASKAASDSNGRSLVTYKEYSGTFPPNDGTLQWYTLLTYTNGYYSKSAILELSTRRATATILIQFYNYNTPCITILSYLGAPHASYGGFTGGVRVLANGSTGAKIQFQFYAARSSSSYRQLGVKVYSEIPANWVLEDALVADTETYESFLANIQATNGCFTGGGLMPRANNTHNIGSSSFVYKDVYATTFHGALSGNATNVTGIVAIANGGTEASTRLGALKNLTNESVGTSAQYFLTITSSWGKGGYTSVADAKTVLAMTGATSSANGTAGVVPAPPKDGYNTKFLKADGTWSIPEHPVQDHIEGPDWRNSAHTPLLYMSTYHKGSLTCEFSSTSVLPIAAASNGFSALVTITPWEDDSGGLPAQLACGDNGWYFRCASTNDTWGNFNVHWDHLGNMYATSYNGGGFKKDNSSDSYVLLGGGGHAPLTNLQVAGTATSVTSLNVELTFIYATLTENATLGLSAEMSVGQVLTILAFNNGSTSITLTVPSAWKSLDGYSINIGALKFGEISILCYASGNYMVSSKIQ